MFTSIKAQVSAYKWVIILSLIGVLTVGLGWQYHRATVLEKDTKSLKDKNTELSDSLDKTNRQIIDLKVSTDKAMADLSEFRESLGVINSQTADLQKKVKGLKNTPVAPGGANAQQLEDQANELTKQAFKRIEDASRGKTK